MRMGRTAAAAVAWAVVIGLQTHNPTAQVDEPESAVIWLDREMELEQYLRDAEVIDIEEIGVGVTNPKRAVLAPGGPVDRSVFKPLRPGNYNGHFESYTSEIAAYELDKLLGLGMTPPTVEKRIETEVGAAVMWAAPTKSFKELGGPPQPPVREIARWNIQLIRAKMFHNLIYNKDPNLGNWLVDPAWNLILIDNSRAFTPGDRMVHELNRIDRDLWDRFLALDEATLTEALGEWLDDGSIRAILTRRDTIADEIQQMIDERGEAHVFVRYVPPAAIPAASDTSFRERVAPDALDDLGGQLLSALHETPVVLEGSELTWSGMLVPLTAYEGPDAELAQAALTQGHEFGIVTEFDGLLSLTRDPKNPEPYEILTGMPGRQVEVFGLVFETDGLSVVQVTLCREHP